MHHDEYDADAPERFAFDPRRGWTSEELEALDSVTLAEILSRDLRVAPPDPATDAPVLRRQIIEEQQRDIARGTIRWVDHTDDYVLYEPATAQAGVDLVRTLASVQCWGDLTHLVSRGGPAAAPALEHVWEYWESSPEEIGVEELAESHWDDVADAHDLLRLVPAATPLRIDHMSDDGDYLFVNPLDPRRMGVPELIVRRYVAERGGMTSSWEIVPHDMFVFAEQTLQALGWTLEPGTREELGVD